MKRLLVILAALLMLAGCTGRKVPETTASTSTASVTVTEATGYYDPDSLAQAQTGGAVLAYPLPESDYGAVMMMGQKLLLVHTSGKLTTLQSERCIPSNTAETGVDLLSDTSFCVSESSVSYYDRINNQVVLLNSQLMELSRISLPEDIQGSPVVSLSDKQVYYAQEGSVRALDIQSGISRLVMSYHYENAQLTDILLDGTLLVLKVLDDKQAATVLYVDAATGEILNEADSVYDLESQSDMYLLRYMDGNVRQWAFGTYETGPIGLNVSTPVYAVFAMSGAVGWNTDSGCLVLDYYDLGTGLRTAAVTIPKVSQVLNITSDSRYIWILAANSGTTTLYRWDIVKSPAVDETVYTGEFYTARHPDQESLALCQARADRLNEQYGIEVCIWEDAVVQTKDYQIVAEHRPETINRMLDELELVLEQYPQNVLSNSIRGGKLCVGLVRSVGEDLSNAQIYSDGNAYILLSPDSQMDWDFAQAFAYVVDSHVLGNSRDFDDWASLNPEGFAYSYDPNWEPDETAASYLQAESRAFIDELAMTDPREDRCRIFLYAMQPDAQSYFSSDVMQLKLRTLCEGIREAYGLEKSKESLPWEQYLTLKMDFSNF